MSQAQVPMPTAAVPLAPRGTRRYTAAAMAFHWITALLIAAILPIAWVMTSLPDEDPTGRTLRRAHASIGLPALASVVVRLAGRATHPAPPRGARAGPLVALLARANHWLLYAVLLVMPISGYLWSATGKHPIPYFALFDVPVIGPSPWLHEAAGNVHVVGQWFVYALVVLHLLGVAYHVVVARDGVLNRILPAQKVA